MNPVRKQPLRTASGSCSSLSAGLPCGERVFKKSRSEGPFDTAEEKRRFIAEHRDLLETVERGCQIMNLPRSTYYHKPKVASDAQDLINDIESIIEEFPGYGYRGVTRELHRRGKPANHKKVHRIMRERGLLKKSKRRWVKTTDTIHNHRIYPNLIQNLAVTGPNQVWSANITYISIRNSFVYLAVILDLFARRAVGYAISRTIDTVLCLEALQMAIENRQTPEGIIHHSDRGLQYASHDYVAMLLKHGFRISMSRKGNPYDNAATESFFKTLKVEEVYLWEYRTLEDVQIRLPFFIQEVCNRKRLHSSLGYRPPVEFEELFFNNRNPCPTALTGIV